MVNAEKQKVRALQAFKTKHVKRLVARYLTSKRNEDDGHVYEEVYLADKLVGVFVYDKKTHLVTIKEVTEESK